MLRDGMNSVSFLRRGRRRRFANKTRVIFSPAFPGRLVWQDSGDIVSEGLHDSVDAVMRLDDAGMDGFFKPKDFLLDFGASCFVQMVFLLNSAGNFDCDLFRRRRMAAQQIIIKTCDADKNAASQPAQKHQSDTSPKLPLASRRRYGLLHLNAPITAPSKS